MGGSSPVPPELLPLTMYDRKIHPTRQTLPDKDDDLTISQQFGYNTLSSALKVSKRSRSEEGDGMGSPQVLPIHQGSDARDTYIPENLRCAKHIEPVVRNPDFRGNPDDNHGFLCA